MTFRYLVITLATIFLPISLFSCGGDDDQPATPKVTLVCRGASIDEGATVNNATTSSITVYFNNLIEIASLSQITLNGLAVSDANADGMNLQITVSLSQDTDYILKIGAGAVAAVNDPAVKNDNFTLNFKTEKGISPTYVATAPVNPKASPEAKALYALLRGNYGKAMFSGAMGGIGWETTYTDFIKAQTGAYPKVVGFDYMHLCWSPANWIDFGDITPVKTAHDKGCIIQIQWHWNVPVAEGSKDFSSNASGNKFNPANILIDGTWEQKVAETDVEKLAGYMQLLQDARIPVLWRPFHEAAGDYKWGAWFWWGSKGTDVTKKLWYWLYDKLTNKYGLNNLIWVWTVCTSTEGRPASLDIMRGAYPGDDYVDMVGTDLYPDQVLTDQSAQFKLVNSVVDGKKMVALTECGNLVSPDKAYENQALWSYFMQWYDYKDGQFGFFNYKGPDQWKTVLGNPLVISIIE